jgi:hypothetical protein
MPALTRTRVHTRIIYCARMMRNRYLFLLLLLLLSLSLSLSLLTRSLYLARALSLSRSLSRALSLDIYTAQMHDSGRSISQTFHHKGALNPEPQTLNPKPETLSQAFHHKGAEQYSCFYSLNPEP